jgi:hypothetical protein
MKESDIEGVAIHGGPESCVCVREDGGEALTGVRAGRAIEPRNQGDRGADAVEQAGRQHRWQRYARAARGPCAVGEPLHARNLHAREPGDPMLARPVDHRAGRSGKAKAAILR